MKTIRVGVFETNSSSTHSITMCMKADFEKFKSGELILHRYNDCLISREKAIETEKGNKYNKDVDWDNEEAVNEVLRDDYKTYEQWCDSDLEGFEEEFTTPNGDVVVSFGEYGYDS